MFRCPAIEGRTRDALNVRCRVIRTKHRRGATQHEKAKHGGAARATPRFELKRNRLAIVLYGLAGSTQLLHKGNGCLADLPGRPLVAIDAEHKAFSSGNGRDAYRDVADLDLAERRRQHKERNFHRIEMLRRAAGVGGWRQFALRGGGDEIIAALVAVLARMAILEWNDLGIEGDGAVQRLGIIEARRFRRFFAEIRVEIDPPILARGNFRPKRTPGRGKGGVRCSPVLRYAA